MHGGRQVILPLLQLKEFDQYTTTHSMNVAVLSMALAEFWGSPGGRASFGSPGCCRHRQDQDSARRPHQAGRLTDEERALMNEHPVTGARILLDVEADLDLAVVVAYEHHIMINGGGYPRCITPATASGQQAGAPVRCLRCIADAAPVPRSVVVRQNAGIS